MVKKTETEPNLILNGRAALCAGRDDMSSDDESESVDDQNRHRFKKPDNFKTILESGAIPDAAMIHEARKKRQKARELGMYAKNKTQSNESLTISTFPKAILLRLKRKNQ